MSPSGNWTYKNRASNDLCGVVKQMPHSSIGGPNDAKACHGGRVLGRTAGDGAAAPAGSPTPVPKDGSGAKAHIRGLDDRGHDFLRGAQKEKEQIRDVSLCPSAPATFH